MPNINPRYLWIAALVLPAAAFLPKQQQFPLHVNRNIKQTTRLYNWHLASKDEVLGVFRKPNAVILDVRSQPEIDSHGLIQTHGRRLWIQLGCTAMECPSLPSAASTLFGDQRMPIIVHCSSGARAAKAKDILDQLGYTQVVNAGGFDDLDYLQFAADQLILPSGSGRKTSHQPLEPRKEDHHHHNHKPPSFIDVDVESTEDMETSEPEQEDSTPPPTKKVIPDILDNNQNEIKENSDPKSKTTKSRERSDPKTLKERIKAMTERLSKIRGPPPLKDDTYMPANCNGVETLSKMINGPPISVQEKEEESHPELERMQQEMAQKQQEMMQMQLKLKSLEQMSSAQDDNDEEEVHQANINGNGRGFVEQESPTFSQEQSFIISADNQDMLGGGQVTNIGRGKVAKHQSPSHKYKEPPSMMANEQDVLGEVEPQGRKVKIHPKPSLKDRRTTGIQSTKPSQRSQMFQEASQGSLFVENSNPIESLNAQGDVTTTTATSTYYQAPPTTVDSKEPWAAAQSKDHPQQDFVPFIEDAQKNHPVGEEPKVMKTTPIQPLDPWADPTNFPVVNSQPLEMDPNSFGARDGRTAPMDRSSIPANGYTDGWNMDNYPVDPAVTHLEEEIKGAVYYNEEEKEPMHAINSPVDPSDSFLQMNPSHDPLDCWDHRSTEPEKRHHFNSPDDPDQFFTPSMRP